MGLFTLTIAGAGFILIGAWESLTFSSILNGNPNQNSIPSSPFNQPTKSIPKTTTNSNHQSSSSLSYFTISIFSFLFILNSLLSLFNAINSQDRVGSVLQLQILAVASLFLLYSILGLVSNLSSYGHFPSSILNLIVLFGFVEEFLLFYMQKKDKNGIENRYFDLMLVPISICVVSTILDLKSGSNSIGYARLARGVGLVFQGTWFVQMGLSFYTNLMVQGCSLHEKSRGNYTIKCKGHSSDHRGRGIATLQFNCHLALLVVLVVGLYSIVGKSNGDRGDFMRYKPLGAELQHLENHGQFTLDSDEDEIGEEELVSKENEAIGEMSVNGHGSHL